LPTQLAGPPSHLVDQVLVPQVHAVKHPNGQDNVTVGL
jgi:hypothetical protein